MSIGFNKTYNGINIVPQSTTAVSVAGDIRYNLGTNQLDIFTTAVEQIVTTNAVQTLTNKTFTTLSTGSITNGAGTLVINSTGTITVPNGTDTLVGRATTDTLTNKTLDNSSVITIKDGNLTIQNAADVTKQIKFSAANVTTGTTATFQVPSASDTLTGNTTAATLTNKTLTTPTIAQIVNGAGTLTLNTLGTYSFPSVAGTDTVVMLALTQTLTNKTLTGNTAANLINGSGTINLNSTGTITVPNATDTLIARATTDTLTNKTIGDALTFAEISTPSSPASTFNKLYFKTDNNLYTLTSAGIETQVGSGAGGTKNYLGTVNNVNGNGNFETGTTTGWSLGTIGTLTNNLPTGSPTFGSGASGNLSISTVNSGQLAGTYSLSYASSAATTVGNMLASQAFNLDIEDQAKVLTFKFYYKVQSGAANVNLSGTNSNSYAVAVYDVTNSVFLTQSANFGMTQGTGVGICTGTFQTGANTASVRFIVYNANATTGAATIYFDDFFIGPQTAPIGTVITDWVAYTPTFTGFGTPTVVAFYSRRVGDSLQVRGAFTSGTATSVQAQVTLGFNGVNANITADASKSGASGNYNQLCGHGALASASSTYFTFEVLQPLANQNYLIFGIQQSTTAATSAANGNAFGSNTPFEFFAEVPIVGWSSNVQMSNDTDTRVVSWNGTQVSQAVTANVTDIAFTTIKDRTGSWNGTQYVVPVSGDYQAQGAIVNSGTGAVVGQVYLNGSFYNNAYFGNTGGGGTPSVGSALLTNLKAGDLISVRTNVSGTITVSSFSIFRLSGPAVIAASESVNGRYHGATGTLTSSFSAITFSTRDRDSHNALNGTTLTIPVSGMYQFNTFIQTSATVLSAGSVTGIALFRNGTQINQMTYAPPATDSGNGITLQISDMYPCLAGDTIVVQALNAGTTPTITSSNISNVFSWARVGN